MRAHFVTFGWSAACWCLGSFGESLHAAAIAIRPPNVCRISCSEAPVACGGKRHAACRN